MSLHPARHLSERAPSLPGNPLRCPECARLFRFDVLRDLHFLQIHILGLEEEGKSLSLDREAAQKRGRGVLFEGGIVYEEPESYAQLQLQIQDEDWEAPYSQKGLGAQKLANVSFMEETLVMEDEREDWLEIQQGEVYSFDEDEDEDAPAQLFEEFCQQELRRTNTQDSNKNLFRKHRQEEKTSVSSEFEPCPTFAEFCKREQTRRREEQQRLLLEYGTFLSASTGGSRHEERSCRLCIVM